MSGRPGDQRGRLHHRAQPRPRPDRSPARRDRPLTSSEPRRDFMVPSHSERIRPTPAIDGRDFQIAAQALWRESSARSTARKQRSALLRAWGASVRSAGQRVHVRWRSRLYQKSNDYLRMRARTCGPRLADGSHSIAALAAAARRPPIRRRSPVIPTLWVASRTMPMASAPRLNRLPCAMYFAFQSRRARRCE